MKWPLRTRGDEISFRGQWRDVQVAKIQEFLFLFDAGEPIGPDGGHRRFQQEYDLN